MITPAARTSSAAPDASGIADHWSERVESADWATGHRTGGLDRPPPNGGARPAFAIPGRAALRAARPGHRHSPAHLSVLQHPHLLDSAAALPHAPGLPRLGVLRRLRPGPWPLSRRRTQPAHAPDARKAGRPRTVPVFTAIRSPKGGARLCPSGLAASTPQTFPAASRSPARHRRWSLDGTWEKILDGLQAGCDEAEGKDWTVSAESTVARAHQHAAGARRVLAADDRTGGFSE
jgi:hypothetical protein